MSSSVTVDPYEKVKTLFDYTKFHMGIYITLGSAMVGVYSSSDKIPFHFYPLILWLSVGFIAIAGLAGGVIASTLPECDSVERFFEWKIGPWGLEWFTGRNWTRIEHTSFWASLLAGLISFALG